MGKELVGCYFDWFGIITTEYKWTTLIHGSKTKEIALKIINSVE
jgi:hypothetical protein